MTGSVRGVGRGTGAADIRPGVGILPGQVTPATMRRRVLFYGVVAVAIASTASGATVALRSDSTVIAADLVIAVAAFAAAQHARVRLRIGSEVILLAWGEVGIIAALCLVPAAWVPVAVGAGAVLGHAHRLFGEEAVRRTRVLYGISALTAGGAAATVVAVAALPADPAAPVRVQLDRPATFVPLLLASLVYFLVTSVLTATWAASVTQRPLLAAWLRAARGKRLMLAGNVAVGLAVALVIAVDRMWLAALAPVLWFLHRGYGHQLRTAQERHAWVALADGIRALNQLDERGVATAALWEAGRIFSPDEVEIVLLGPSGRRRGYRARAGELSRATPDGVTAMPGAGPAVGARHAVVRRLAVGGAHLGELRLRFRRPVALGTSEQHAFSTFADAVAAALHDAATHRRLRAMTARSAYDAVYDPLTGLGNRSTLLTRGNAELRRTEPGRHVALVLLDVDGLRAVNDAISHEAGDELLQVLAGRLSDGQGEGEGERELVGRLGGDVFAVLLTGGAPAPGAGPPAWAYPLDRARSITAALAVPAEVCGVTIAVEASAGVVVESADRCDMTELLRRADVALHQAKREGSRVARYEATADTSSTDRLALLADLRDALATTDQLTIDLQLTVDMLTGVPTGAEALARWRHPRRGLLAPAEFVGAVEHSGLVGGFTGHILDLALAVAGDWAGRGAALPVSVNLCARCTLDRDLPDQVAGRLAAHGVPPHRLILEITEDVMAAEGELAGQVIAGLRATGVQVSIDHFGTGSASLLFLTRFGVDEVKIDRSFVATMVDSPEAAAIVRTTVDLARELGLRVVAEGVERPEQRAALIELGVTSGQGFLFHPPLPVAQTAAILRGEAIPAVRSSSA